MRVYIEISTEVDQEGLYQLLQAWRDIEQQTKAEVHINVRTNPDLSNDELLAILRRLTPPLPYETIIRRFSP